MLICIFFSMLTRLLPTNIFDYIKNAIPIQKVTEIRIRLGRRIVVKSAFNEISVDYKPTENDIQEIIRTATRNSLYAYQDEIKKGYIPFEGIRIGLSGSGVTDGEKIITIKDFTSLTIRVPHEVVGCAEKLVRILNVCENTLIISPPYGGKTTLIRDIARLLSGKYETLIVDERGEIYNESYTFGDKVDVFSNTPKNMVIEGIIRSISPEVIVLDELFSESDDVVLGEIDRCGVKIIASIHALGVEQLKKHNPKLLEHFVYAVELSNKPKVGSIKSIVRLK